MSVISTDYTTFFFIVCIHRHGMMELQLMSRNEFLLCLIEKKNKIKKFLFLAAHIHEAPCSRSGRYHLHEGFWEQRTCELLGPTKCLQNCLILRIEKRNQLSETSKRSKGYTINQKVPQIFKILISMYFFVPLETELSWNAERRRNVF